MRTPAASSNIYVDRFPRMTVRLNLHDTLIYHMYIHDMRDDDLRGRRKFSIFQNFFAPSSHTVMSRRVACWSCSLTTADLWFLAVTALDFGDQKEQLGDH